MSEFKALKFFLVIRTETVHDLNCGGAMEGRIPGSRSKEASHRLF